jgi:hypothetical protein
MFLVLDIILSCIYLNLSSKLALKGRLWTHHALRITDQLFKFSYLNLSSKLALKGRLWTHHALRITDQLFKFYVFTRVVHPQSTLRRQLRGYAYLNERTI